VADLRQMLFSGGDFAPMSSFLDWWLNSVSTLQFAFDLSGPSAVLSEIHGFSSE